MIPHRGPRPIVRLISALLATACMVSATAMSPLASNDSPNAADTPASASPAAAGHPLPNGCQRDSQVDYPGAFDCIVDPAAFDCKKFTDTTPCAYDSADRPHDFDLKQIVIHDDESTVQEALNVFRDPKKAVSVQYIVDTDGTVYQTLHEKDVPYGAGNFWYNQHSINIEHPGFAATGFQWYNSAQYLASAKLVAHLLQKYGLPADHDHVIGHSQVPGPTLGSTPNHADPGPYWLWTYYLGLIQAEGRAPDGDATHARNVIVITPSSDRRPLGPNGTETPANFNYFYLYRGPSTDSGLIPQLGSGSDVLDVTNNVEAQVSYAYLNQVSDPAGTGMTMYEIWYGAFDQAHARNPSKLQTGQRAWLAVPAGAVRPGDGRVVSVSGSNGGKAGVYGRPTTKEDHHIGDLPAGAVVLSAYSVTEDGTTNLWYEINFNHRQAWVPANEVTLQ